MAMALDSVAMASFPPHFSCFLYGRWPMIIKQSMDASAALTAVLDRFFWTGRSRKSANYPSEAPQIPRLCFSTSRVPPATVPSAPAPTGRPKGRWVKGEPRSGCKKKTAVEHHLVDSKGAQSGTVVVVTQDALGM